MLKMAKKVPNNLRGQAFYKIFKGYFNQKILPITYHNFRHQSLTRPKILKLKRVSNHKLQSQFLTERKHAPSRCQVQYNLPK